MPSISHLVLSHPHPHLLNSKGTGHTKARNAAGLEWRRKVEKMMTDTEWRQLVGGWGGTGRLMVLGQDGFWWAIEICSTSADHHMEVLPVFTNTQ